MPTRDDVLKQIALDFNFSEQWLIAYANQDEIAGKDNGNEYGTEFTDDGNILYALVRYLQPQEVLEIGTHHGGSAVHIATALLDDGGGGYVETVDIDENAGSGIHAFYNSVLTQVTANIDLYLPELIEKKRQFDFIFEDGLHSEGQVHNIYNAMRHILKPGGYIMSHDTAMDGVGEYIRNGMRKGGANMDKMRFYQVDGTPGFSLYRFEG